MTHEKVQTPADDNPCENCGSFEVLKFAGKILCADYAALAGCGCAGHGEENSAS